jgi:hypothetical protein
MTHPFFDATSFPWARTDAKTLNDLLIIVLTNKPEIVGIYQRSGGVLGDLDQGQAPADVWHDVLDLLATGGKLRALCDELLAVSRLQGNAAFQAAVRAIEDARPAVEQRWFGDEIVLDRQPLRSLIATLEGESSRLNVIIVRGEAKSGRSYGRVLFEQAAADHGAVAVYIFAGLVATDKELIDQLAVALDGSPEDISPPDSTRDAWHRTVCLDLQRLAQRTRRRLWVAVDDLGFGADDAPLLDPQIRDFCNQFAISMLNPAFRNWFRLLLIDYPSGPVPTRWRSEIWSEDRTSATDIGEAEVVEFLEDWARSHALISTSDIAQLAADVLLDADTRPPRIEGAPRLQRINESLSQRLTLLKSRAIRS